MEKRKIKDQMGELEEQLERLALYSDPTSAPLVQRASESLRDLQENIRSQAFEKSLSAQDFLQRISGVLIREAQPLGFDLAITTCGTGRISLEMVETAMGAVLACLRAALKSHQGITPSERGAQRLFLTHAFYLEARATSEAVYFRLMDDGPGYAGLQPAAESQRHFLRLRAHLAKFGGWFRRKSLKAGGVIEFKVPLSSSRFDCIRLRQGGFTYLVPATCVSERRLAGGDALAGAVARMDEVQGLVATEPTGIACAVKIGVADFEFWLSCDEVGDRVKARRLPAGDLVEPSSWFRAFGIFHEGGRPAALPFLDGETLMEFHAKGENK